MDRPTSEAQASRLRKPLFRLGAPATTLFMLGLCTPLAWYAGRLLDRHGPAARLADPPPLELLLAMALLALPFAVLRLLRVDWQPDR